MKLQRMFVEHPASVGETYFSHLLAALGIGMKLIGAGIACGIHALVPFVFEHSASDCVRRLNERLSQRRAAPAVAFARRHTA